MDGWLSVVGLDVLRMCPVNIKLNKLNGGSADASVVKPNPLFE